jgi:hypothetical protein
MAGDEPARAETNTHDSSSHDEDEDDMEEEEPVMSHSDVCERLVCLFPFRRFPGNAR